MAIFEVDEFVRTISKLLLCNCGEPKVSILIFKFVLRIRRLCPLEHVELFLCLVSQVCDVSVKALAFLGAHELAGVVSDLVVNVDNSF